MKNIIFYIALIVLSINYTQAYAQNGDPIIAGVKQLRDKLKTCNKETNLCMKKNSEFKGKIKNLESTQCNTSSNGSYGKTDPNDPRPITPFDPKTWPPKEGGGERSAEEKQAFLKQLLLAASYGACKYFTVGSETGTGLCESITQLLSILFNMSSKEIEEQRVESFGQLENSIGGRSFSFSITNGKFLTLIFKGNKVEITTKEGKRVVIITPPPGDTTETCRAINLISRKVVFGKYIKNPDRPIFRTLHEKNEALKIFNELLSGMDPSLRDALKKIPYGNTNPLICR